MSAQTYEATYEFEINKDYFKKVINDEIEKGKDPSLLKKAFSRYFDSRPIKAKFIFNSNRSYYYLIRDMGVDKQSRIVDPIILFSGKRNQYFNNENEDFVFIHIKSGILRINEFLLKSDFKPAILKDKSKIIDKYKCNLAQIQYSKKQTLNLWYTKDIPTQFNIIDFARLPGLLVKIESEFYVSNLLSLKQVDESKLKKPPQNIQLISEPEYKKMLDETNPYLEK